MPTLHLGFLASHGGSNVQAIIDSIKSNQLDAVPEVIISNNSDSTVLKRAENENIPGYHISSATSDNPDKEIIDTLKKYNVDTVVLAGYMKKISPDLIKAFNGRVLNIHPALLPKFGGKGMYGMNVHKAVIEAGEKFSGATIHLVTEIYDEGKILNQKKVEVETEDDAESLAARVLKAEHKLYSETLQKISTGEIKI